MEQESIFVDYKGQLEEKLNEVKNTVVPFSDNDVVRKGINKIEDIYSVKLKDVKPQIMVYGIYNAGKSSIINELIKDDKAQVADRPMTDRVDYYEWNGYQLADTPGVGAPMEHEDVTNAHLSKADVVLFVMSTNGSTERRQNYERMKDIANAGKKIIIVLNDKDGVLGAKDDITIPTIKSQVAENMKAVGISASNSYYIVPVNAKRAHKGRTENKKVMYAKSNIEELEKVVLAELRKTTPFMIMHNSIIELEKVLEEMIEGLQTDTSGEIDRLNQLLNNIRKSKKILRDHMRDYVQGKTSRLGREVPSRVWPICISDKSSEEIQRSVNDLVMDEVSKKCQQIQNELHDQLREHLDELQIDIDELKSMLETKKTNPNVNINIEALEVQNIESFGISVNTESLIDKLDMASTAIKATGEFLKSSAGKAMLKTLGGTVIGKSVMPIISKVIGPIGGPAGWVITGISVLKSILGGNNEEEERRAAEVRAQAEQLRRQKEAEAEYRHELYQKCEYMAEDLADTLVHDINNSIDNIFKDLEAPFKESLQANRNIAASITAVCDKLNSIYSEYDMIDSKIAARVNG